LINVVSGGAEVRGDWCRRVRLSSVPPTFCRDDCTAHVANLQLVCVFARADLARSIGACDHRVRFARDGHRVRCRAGAADGPRRPAPVDEGLAANGDTASRRLPSALVALEIALLAEA
jgi:hypothetical protein